MRGGPYPGSGERPLPSRRRICHHSRGGQPHDVGKSSFLSRRLFCRHLSRGLSRRYPSHSLENKANEFQGVDFLVDTDPTHVRRPLTQYPGFEIESNNLFYKADGKSIKVDTFDKERSRCRTLTSSTPRRTCPITSQTVASPFPVSLKIPIPMFIFKRSGQTDNYPTLQFGSCTLP